MFWVPCLQGLYETSLQTHGKELAFESWTSETETFRGKVHFRNGIFATNRDFDHFLIIEKGSQIRAKLHVCNMAQDPREYQNFRKLEFLLSFL